MGLVGVVYGLWDPNTFSKTAKITPRITNHKILDYYNHVLQSQFLRQYLNGMSQVISVYGL